MKERSMPRMTRMSRLSQILSTAAALGGIALLPLLLGLKAGEPAPAFALKNQDARVMTLAAEKGHPVLIYFYPKDGTPGCTTEACTLRDSFANMQKQGAVIFGVSTQDAKSHQQFRAAQKLPFDLLIDPNGTTAKKYGVGMIPGTDLLERKSVLIGPDGKIAKMYETVNPAQHAQEVLKDLAALKKAS
jgi:peroxiredoxin Q/BCP